MLASELITRALRLINVPGRGSRLRAEDQADAFEALQELLDSEAVSKAFVPGIRRHFFNMNTSQAIYSYGASPQADFRSDDFDNDPAPIRIEDAYIRDGSSIVNNELVDEYRFENVASWVVAGAAEIANNRLVIEQGIGSVAQAVPADTSGGTTYTLRVNADVIRGSFDVALFNDGVEFDFFNVDTVGQFSYDFVWPAGDNPSIEVRTTDATDDIRINTLSIIERGKDRLVLPDGLGSDYMIREIDQKTYNRQFSKGNLGRPYQFLYSRQFPLAEIRFESSALPGDLLVLDVLVNQVMVNRLEDEIRLHPSATKWLRYALAANVASEYGKALTPQQMHLKEDAWAKLSTGNRRLNTLRIDRGLRKPRSFDINRGDP